MVLILTPTHPAFETANVMLPALVGCTLKEAVPFEALVFVTFVTPAPETTIFAPGTTWPSASLTVTLIVAVVLFGIADVFDVAARCVANTSDWAADHVPPWPCESVACTRQ